MSDSLCSKVREIWCLVTVATSGAREDVATKAFPMKTLDVRSHTHRTLDGATFSFHVTSEVNVREKVLCPEPYFQSTFDKTSLRDGSITDSLTSRYAHSQITDWPSN